MKIINSGVVAGFAVATLVSLAPAAQAAGEQTTVIRQGNFVSALADTRSAGHVEFLKEGLHVWTDDATGNAKAAQYFAVPAQGLPSAVSLDWYGTQPQPGSQVVFDMDSDRGNANTYNILVGEPVYGDDYWYTGGQARAAQRGFTCPQTTGGSGSDCHGTLAEWKTAVPSAEVYAFGFSLGSGIKGDGVLRDIKVDAMDYGFTSEPTVTTVPVTGAATGNEVVRPRATTLKLRFATDALGQNQVAGKKLTFKVKDNNEVVFRDTMGPGERSSVKLRFADGSGKHKVQVLKNGVVDRTYKINLGH